MSGDRFTSPNEYLELERTSESRHEYMFGQVSRVSGKSPQHSLITANVCIALGKRLQGGPCRVFDSSLRVCLDPATAFYVYPDVTVVEGPIRCLEDADETLVNPKVVVEVLSPSSKNLELGGKARMYTRVGSLMELVMVDQDRVAVEHWVRGDGDWKVTTLEAPSAVLKLESIGCEVPVSEIYSGIERKQPRKV
jgi:Uma2 family endonuclease